jgi:hypothetical protein
MAALFDVSIPTINFHLKKIFESGELTREATIRKFRIVRTEGNSDVLWNREVKADRIPIKRRVPRHRPAIPGLVRHS